MARRGGVLVVLVVVVAFVGVGVALLVAGGLMGLGIALLEAGRPGRNSLRAPGVAAALGAELIVAALLLSWRVGARISDEEDDGDDRGPG